MAIFEKQYLYKKIRQRHPLSAQQYSSNTELLLPCDHRRSLREPSHHGAPSSRIKQSTAYDDAVQGATLRAFQSLKYNCLLALDSIRKHMTVRQPAEPSVREMRRFSEPSTIQLPGERLHPSGPLDLVAQETEPTAAGLPCLMHSDTAPNSADVPKTGPSLHSKQLRCRSLDDEQDHDLCRALTSLLNKLDDITGSATAAEAGIPNDQGLCFEAETDQDIRDVYRRNRDRGSTFRREHSLATMSLRSTLQIFQNRRSNRRDVIGRLLEAVFRLDDERLKHMTPLDIPPPAYSELQDGQAPPPNYEVAVSSWRPHCDLDELLVAMDRLGDAIPRLDNQRVDITAKRIDELIEVATVERAVERLSRGRMEDQRASLPPPRQKDNAFRDMTDNKYQRASRTPHDQRTLVSPKLQRKMDADALSGLMDRFRRGRLVNQDWEPPTNRPVEKTEPIQLI